MYISGKDGQKGRGGVEVKAKLLLLRCISQALMEKREKRNSLEFSRLVAISMFIYQSQKWTKGKGVGSFNVILFVFATHFL